MAGQREIRASRGGYPPKPRAKRAFGGIATGLERFVEAVLYCVTPTDPIAIGGAVAAMLIVALIASWPPARCACRLDPMVALRHG